MCITLTFNKSTIDILLQQCIFLQLVQSFLSQYWRCSVLDSNSLILQNAAQPAVTLEKKANSNTSCKRPRWSTKTSRYIFFHYAINIPGTQWTCWYFFRSKCSVMIRCPLLKCTSLVSLMYITANHTPITVQQYVNNVDVLSISSDFGTYWLVAVISTSLVTQPLSH